MLHVRTALALLLASLATSQTITLRAAGLDVPTCVISWPGNSDVLVVAERGSARVSIVPPVMPARPSMGGGTTIEYPTLLDLSGKAAIPGSANAEFHGLTGVAFDPEFLTDTAKRYLYVRYTDTQRMVIERYYVPVGSREADPNSDTIVYENGTLVGSIHNSGYISFAPKTTTETWLYFGLGDNEASGASCVDLDHPQLTYVPSTPDTHWGKVLRVDVEPVTATFRPDPEEIAKGLRNPFAISVDPGDDNGDGAGDVYYATTGRDTTGEVMWRPATATGIPNHGWPCVEGDPNAPNEQTHKTTTCSSQGYCPGSYTPPQWTILQNTLPGPGHNAILGGHVCREPGALNGLYVYGLHGCGTGTDLHAITLPLGSGATSAPFPLSGFGWPWADETFHGIGTDDDGSVYLIRVNAGGTNPLIDNGRIYKVNH